TEVTGEARRLVRRGDAAHPQALAHARAEGANERAGGAPPAAPARGPPADREGWGPTCYERTAGRCRHVRAGPAPRIPPSARASPSDLDPPDNAGDSRIHEAPWGVGRAWRR